jgi:hypothetical protein
VVDVLDPAVTAEAVTPTQVAPAAEPAASPAPRTWTRHAPLLLVGFAVAFTAWLLRAEIHTLPYANDHAVHSSMARFAEQRILAGYTPFDAWYPYLGLGSPQFSQYQGLAHIVTGALSIVFGPGTYGWTTLLLLSTWPISVYAGARLLGLDRWQAGFAALFSPMLSNISGYGYEWWSFTWVGVGLWSMLWALWLLPIALGLAWRAIAYRERVTLATFVVGLTCALHFTTGYFVLLALGAFVLVRPRAFAPRLGRAAVVGIGGLVTFSFVFVPVLAGQRFQNFTSYQADTFWVDSFGAANVIGWLGRGEIFDYGRPPVVSLFVAAGVAACAFRVARSEGARLPLALMVLGLLLYSGRSVVGPALELLPGGSRMQLHRYIIAVHFAGILLAGIGAVAGVRAVRRFPAVRAHAVVTGLVVAGVLVAAFIPLAVNRYAYAEADRSLIDEQAAAQRATGDLDELIAIARERGDGRIYAGASNNWGIFVRNDQLPVYMEPVNLGADGLGLFLRTDSMSADVEPSFDDKVRAQYDLFNIRYLLLRDDFTLPVPDATQLARRGDFSLYEVPTTGYLDVVDATEPVAADNTDMAAVMQSYLASEAVAQKRQPLVAFDGASTPPPSLDADAPYTGPPGTVRDTRVDLLAGRFSTRVHAERDAWVMLKESYHPHWTATVDGEPVEPSMLAPSFVGVPVPAGDHTVRFTYRPSRSYPALFSLGALTLSAIATTPLVARRVRGRRTARSA